MNTSQPLPQPEGSALWIYNYVNGFAGIAMRAKHSICCDASPFQKIEVFETYGFGRVLILGGTIVLTEKDEFIYNEMIAHPALLAHSVPRRVCIIGGGDGGALRQVLRHGEVEDVCIVEIDRMVIETIRAHFPWLASGFDDSRVRIVIADGCGFLEKTEERFDVIIVDSYDPGGPVQSLLSEPFYPLVSGRLSGGGIAVFQTDSPTVNPHILRTTIASVESCFRHCRPYICSFPSFPEGICGFCLCSRQEAIPDTIDSRRAAILAESCRYFNEDIYKGAFFLPRHIRELC